MKNTLLTPEFLKKEFNENQTNIEDALVELLVAEAEGELDSVSESNLATFRKVFDWDAEYLFTSYWNASIPYDVETQYETNDPEFARAVLEGNEQLDEPEVDDWETHKHIEFDSEPIDKELSEVTLNHISLKGED